jgi:thiamine pyrophosphate-dependent acetolactate synthase large subunit-like protein
MPRDEQMPDRAEAMDRPLPVAASDNRAWGSDAIADVLRALEIPFIALNPGASYRGLHDSLVNRLGNTAPQMLVCLHEEHAVALAHGYYKASGRPIAAALHSNVGLMHGTMAIFNAWCDRVPVLVIGATGPVDAARRRPWIDWIHSAQDQGALVRPYVKWDAQPASVPAAREALLRAHQIMDSAPRGPVYVNLDAALQEAPLDALPVPPDPGRYAPPPPPAPNPALLAQAATLLAGAQRLVILMGRTGRTEAEWDARVQLAERLGARVATDLKCGATFPTDHPLHIGAPGTFASPALQEALREADVVLALDWIDLGGTLRAAGAENNGPRVVQVSPDQRIHNGWSFDHGGLPPADLYFDNEPDVVVRGLLGLLPERAAPGGAPAGDDAPPPVGEGALTIAGLAASLRRGTPGRALTLIRLPLGWDGALRHFRHPLDYLGQDGGGGIGSGPGMAVGAALALRGSGRLPVAILGDGDTMMGLSALWTAAHYRVPLLVIVSNNRSFFNDEVHQERVARERGRPVENKWVGQSISDPDPDFATLARGLGLLGLGPVADEAALDAALAEAVAHVEAGGVALVDARVAPGYAPSMAKALTREPGQH